MRCSGHRVAARARCSICLAGFLPVESGNISVGGKRVAGPGPDRGIVFQQPLRFFPWKTVRQNVLYGLEKQRMPKPEREKRAQELIELVHLKGFEELSYPSQLSGGMKQRVAIARALSYRPEDAADGRALRRARRHDPPSDAGTPDRHQRRRLTVLFVTHDVDEAIYLADRIAVMTPHPAASKRSSTPGRRTDRASTT